MKISNQTNILTQAYSNNAVHQNQTAAANMKSDKTSEINSIANSSSVDLSNRTKDLQKISQALENEPASISEKVIRLKKEIDEGQYNINADKIADKMTGSLFDKII